MIRQPSNRKGYLYALAAAIAFSVAALTSGHADDAAPELDDLPSASIAAPSEVGMVSAAPRVPDPGQTAFLGDADLRPLVELERMQVADGRYQIGLEDGRTAVLTIDPRLQERADAILAEARSEEHTSELQSL